MKQTGHYGVSLLLYAPVSFVLLAQGDDGMAVLGGALVVALAMTPDCDRFVPFTTHRGPTHSLVFAVVVGAVVGAAGWTVGARVDPATATEVSRFAFGIGTLSVVSHLLADVITPMGIRPFWPFSDRHFTFDLVLAKNWSANVLLLATGVTATLLVVYASRGG